MKLRRPTRADERIRSRESAYMRLSLKDRTSGAFYKPGSRNPHKGRAGGQR